MSDWNAEFMKTFYGQSGLPRNSARRNPRQRDFNYQPIESTDPLPMPVEGVRHYESLTEWQDAVSESGRLVWKQTDKGFYIAFNEAQGRSVIQGEFKVQFHGGRGEGYIYNDQLTATNPLRRRPGESQSEFMRRCMHEEKGSFPRQRQRVAVCLSKVRENPARPIPLV